jgi:hypothetical protein
MSALYQQQPLFVISKVCTKCHQDKPLDEFFKSEHGKYGRRADCKDCCARPGRPRRIKQTSRTGYKICNTCLLEKPHAEFSPDSVQKDGYTGRCKQCRSQKYQALPEEEKERARKQDKESRIPRIEQRRAYDRKRHNTDEHNAKRREQLAFKKATDASFREAVSRANAEWRKNNPLAIRETNRRHKIGQKAARSGERISYKRILERDGAWCYICACTIDLTITSGPASLAFDHMTPLHPRKGEPKGTHTADNIHPSHKLCNERKMNKQFENLSEWDRRGVD